MSATTSPVVQQPGVFLHGAAALGLQSLEALAEVSVQQTFTLAVEENCYVVRTAQGGRLFTAHEQSDALERCCFGADRNLALNLKDTSDHVVMRMIKPASTKCCFSEVQAHIDVLGPRNTFLGRIEKKWNLIDEVFEVQTCEHEVIFNISGPPILLSCSSVDFQVTNKSGVRVARISKLSGGLFTTADHYRVTFPLDLRVDLKALLVAACLLIDYTLFERK